MLFILFCTIIKALATAKVEVNHSLRKCTNKCVANDVENIKECTGLCKRTATFILFKKDEKTPLKICPACFNKTWIIKTIEQESAEAVEYVLKLSANKEVTLLKHPENGLFGIKAGKFYIIAVTNKYGTYFNRYRFLGLDENIQDQCFEPNMLFYKSVLEPEMGIFLYYSYFKGLFRLKSVVPHSDEDLKTLQKFIDYSTYLYYIFFSFFISWLVVIMVLVQRYITDYYKKKKAKADQ